MLCRVCENHRPEHYMICRLCREVLVRLPTENRSKFIEEMMQAPVSSRDRIRARHRDQLRNRFTVQQGENNE